MIKVSVIMPVYNEEACLEESLISVMNQTLREIEIICVDDGSTDNSLTILKNHAEQDERIKVLQQNNSGPGPARNLGIKIAKGEYLAFLDSDDKFEPEMLENLYAMAKEDDLDVAVCRCDLFDHVSGEAREALWSLKTKLLPAFKPFSCTDIPRNFFAAFVWWPWDKLYRKELIDGLGIEFPNLRNSEDLVFVAAAVLKAERISYTEKILAHHRTGLKSSVSVSRLHSWDCFYHALVMLKQFLKEQNLYERFESDFINYALHFSLWHLDTLHGSSYYLLYYALKEKWFAEFDVLGHPEDFYYDRLNYLQMNSIMELDLEACLNHKIKAEQQYRRSTAENTSLKTRMEEQRRKSTNEIASLKTRMEEQRRKSTAEITSLKTRMEEQHRKSSNEIEKLKENNRKLKFALDEVHNSLSFKAGRAITYVPRKIRDFIKK